MLIIIVVLVLLLGIKLAVLFLEPRMIFFPPKDYPLSPQQLSLKYSEANIETADGETLRAWHFPCDTSRHTILFFHGNAENISSRLDFADRLLALGTSVLLLDYRGYGKSTGKPSEKGIYEDALAGYKYLTDSLSIRPDNIILWGSSIGAAAALDLATKVKVRGLILEGGFTSAREMSQEILPYIPLHWFASYKFDNLAKIPDLQVPVLIIHAEEDEIVPWQMGKALYDKANQPKYFYTVEGAGHNDTFERGGEQYFQKVKEFIYGELAEP
ncbi:MAG: hypothetical protein A2Z27_05965 [candidate division Zixibacteria bacterium RBG_16_50_21]|nr:MAG: hypothetical protein A2Z27_05965 [candidate division Zixibacteria bacterium RBG_16_50_21]